MLLNQCLAISLSPVAAAFGNSTRGKFEDEEFVVRTRSSLVAEQEAIERRFEKSEAREENDHHAVAATKADNNNNNNISESCEGQCQSSRFGWQQKEGARRQQQQQQPRELRLKHSSALLLFNQLVEQNCPPLSGRSNQAIKSRSKEDEEDVEEEENRVETINNQQRAASYGSLIKKNNKAISSLGCHSTSSSGAKDCDAEQQQLCDALGRVEFAGFVMPTWLLVSGSYDDLHCIRSSWTEGNLKAPAGFKIETIGNIRSVNVDYFGFAASELNNLEEEARIAKSGREKENYQVNRGTSGNERRNIKKEAASRRVESSVKQPQPQQARLSRLPYRCLDKHRLPAGPEFAWLNAAIIDSVCELSGKSLQRQHNQQAIVSGAKVAPSVGGVHVSSLIEHLSSKCATNLIDLPTTELIDCAISTLVEGSKLRLKPMTQERAAKLELDQQQRQQRQTRRRNYQNVTAGSLDAATIQQSAFLDQLILPGDSDNNNGGVVSSSACNATDDDDDEQSLSGAELLMSQHRRVSRVSSASTTKSKSTTLDSGIQSWDLVSSPAATEDLENNSAGNSSNSSPSSLGTSELVKQSHRHDHQKAPKLQQQQQASLARQHDVEDYDQDERCRLGNDGRRELIMMAVRRDNADAAAEQVAPSGRAKATKAVFCAVDTAPVLATAKLTGDHKRRRRGFSLGRSFSFRPKKSATVMNENDSSSNNNKKENDQDSRWRSASAKRAHLSECVVDHGATTSRQAKRQQQQSADTNCDLYASQRKISNLSSLFRSKSMRIISSGKASASEQTATTRVGQQQRLQRCIYSNNNHYDNLGSNMINAYDAKYANEPGEYHFERSTPSHWLEGSQANQRGRQHQQATIDYLATAQPHKRSFSTRRLTFIGAKDDMSTNTGCSENAGGGNGGKIVLFLRKLFHMRKTRLLAEGNSTTITTTNGYCDGEQCLVGHSHSNCYSYDNQQAPSHGGARNESTAKGGHSLADQQRRSATARCSRLGPKHFSASSSSSSSGSNSLIEILDCSRAVNSSKRLLREENHSLSSNRATWRLVRRPDSSLSHSSRASCETIKSTVSQQLRRHLDEAYKRHRNCTNQREKEFIDSINVLRQASRHALQNSHSSSKVRQAKSAKSASASDDNASSVGSTYASATHSSSPAAATATHKINGDLQACANCNCNQQRQQHSQERQCKDGRTQNRLEEDSEELSLAKQATRRRSHSPESEPVSAKTQDSFDLIMRREQPVAAAGNANRQQWLQAPSCEHSNLSNCCICTSYLSSTRLCPLACCSAAGPSAVPCCLAALPSQSLRQQQQQQMSPSANIEQQGAALPQATQHSCALAASAESFCCPLWRSMVFNYCPSAFPITTTAAYQAVTNPLLAAASSQQQLAPVQAQTADQLQQFGSQVLENYSTTSSMHQHQVQQHQHNTTIDLKIEIGANLIKQANSDSKQHHHKSQSQREQQSGSSAAKGSRRHLIVEPPSSDSLDSNNDDNADDDHDGQYGDSEPRDNSLEANSNVNGNKITICEYEHNCDSGSNSIHLDSLQTDQV